MRLEAWLGRVIALLMLGLNNVCGERREWEGAGVQAEAIVLNIGVNCKGMRRSGYGCSSRFPHPTTMRLLLHIFPLVLLITPGLAQPAPFLGFDRNLYPGDARLPALRKHFAFTGYWLTPPPGQKTTTWAGKRTTLRKAGFGFLVLANGRLEAQINSAQIPPELQGKQDALQAIALAKQEGFPTATILFLDQEEGGRLTSAQSAYLFAWTEAVAASAYRPGLYLSGQPVPDGGTATITTAQDVQAHIAQHHLHPVTLWVYQDACPPAPGCVLSPPPLAVSGTPGALVWQYAQSPRRPEITHACVITYAPDNNCYAGLSSNLSLDLDTATTADPSHGR